MRGKLLNQWLRSLRRFRSRKVLVKTYRPVGRALILCGVLCALSGLAQTWLPTGAPLTNWSCIACSADGMKVAAGADGIMVEIHPNPDKALSDGIQSIIPTEYAELMSEVRQIASVLHRHLN